MIIRSVSFLLAALVAVVAAPPGWASAEPPSAEALAARIASLEVSGEQIDVAGRPSSKRSPSQPTLFTRRQGNEMGIDHIDVLSPNHFFPPFWNGRGLSAGDVDQDGFEDLLVATEHGIRLFLNNAGLLFTEVPLDVPGMTDFAVHAVALVDVDNDGWLDLFFTTYSKGNHFIRNDHGRFEAKGLVEVAGRPMVLTKSLSFGDVDEDGDLDAVAGNWFFGYAKREPPAEAINKLLLWEDGNYRAEPFAEIPGDTLSILLSDFSQDGHLDLIVGNDFTPPDYYYLGDGAGGFRMITREDGIIPTSTDTTMSIDTGDIDNDTKLDIYVAQIAAGATGPAAHIKRKPFARYCDAMNRDEDRAPCRDTMVWKALFKYGSLHQPSNITKCKQISEREPRLQCAALMTLLTAIHVNEPRLCDRIPAGLEEARFMCRNYFRPSVVGTPAEYAKTVDIIMHENVLLMPNAKGKYKNVAKQMGVEISAWSWNARILDLDNDGWQDIYVVNGTWAGRGAPQKFFFRNLQGQRFEESTEEAGLQNYMIQSAYVAFDADADGDLDLMTASTNGPLWFYRNNDADGSSILFDVRDDRGNRYGVGCKVTVHHGDESQIREIKAGGGFLSFDAPFAHFGLGQRKTVDAVEIEWSTGGKTMIRGELPANARYTITRTNPLASVSQGK